MKKVLFLTNYPSPYRVAFFDMLGQELDTTVLYAEEYDKNNKHQGLFIDGTV